MRRLVIVTTVAVLALLPAYASGMAGGHHRGWRGDGPGNSEGKGRAHSEQYAWSEFNGTPVAVPEPGTAVLLASAIAAGLLGGVASGLVLRKKRS